MDVDSYVMERLVESRLAEARARSARYALLSSLRPPRPSVLAVAALALIRVGRWLGGRRPLRASNRTSEAAEARTRHELGGRHHPMGHRRTRKYEGSPSGAR